MLSVSEASSLLFDFPDKTFMFWPLNAHWLFATVTTALYVLDKEELAHEGKHDFG